ncbi:MAG: phage tail tube protein [Thalassobaculaceae bacterium]
MANPNRVAGTLFFKVDGTQYKAKGNFEYDLGAPKREAITGPDGVHGYKEMPKAPYVTGAITNDGAVDLDTLFNLDGATVTLEQANGKTVVLENAWYAGDGKVTTEEGEVEIRFEGLSAKEIS